MPTRLTNDSTALAWDRLRQRRLEVAALRLREAGRSLQLVGVSDIEADRLARIAFRLASRVRADRLEVAA